MIDCLVCKKPIEHEGECYEIRYGEMEYPGNLFHEFYPDSDLGYVHDTCLNLKPAV